MTGVVKKVIGQKQFGFIIADGTEYFFHRDDFNGHWEDLISDSETETIEVQFVPSTTAKGPRASDVRRTDFPNQAV
jgi:cold shock CspA family protein